MIFSVLIFTVFAVPIAVIDMKEKRIPDVLSLGGSLLLVLLIALRNPGGLVIKGVEWAGAFTLFWGLRRGSGNKLGMGDVKYAGFMALALGFPDWFLAVAAASLAGLCFALGGLRLGLLDRRTRIPFAPFLTAGTWAAFGLSRFFGGSSG
jgi:leader peptidase (prepilin peptidase)/N-methyltransferase